MSPDVAASMQEDINRQAAVLKAQRRILAILEPFDDPTARRILGAAAVLTGNAVAVALPKESE